MSRLLEGTPPSNETTHPKHIIDTQVVEELEEDELTEDQYFQNPALNYNCIDHVKMMEVGYSCMDSKSMTLEDVGSYEPDDIKGRLFQSLFVVSKNGRKYFMKIMDSMYDIEMKLQRMFSEDMFGLWFLEYKIIRGRFVGIYMYMKHKNTMKYQLDNNMLSLYDKVWYLEKLITMASDFFTRVNPQNNLIQLNLTPSNTLCFQEGSQSIRLISYLVSNPIQKKSVLAPEYFDDDLPVNQKATSVYAFAKIIFVYLFGRLHTKPILDDEPEVQALNKSDSNSSETRVMQYLIFISRAMLNENPVDRPSLELVISQIGKALEVLNDPWKALTLEMMNYRALIKMELREEQSEYEDKVRFDARKRALAENLKRKKSNAQKDERYEKALEQVEQKGQMYFDFVGMASNCKIKPTYRMTNYLDIFGFVPVLNTLTAENDEEADNMLVTQEKVVKLDDPDNLRRLRFEFFLIMGVSMFIICIVIAYFSFKGMEVKMYQKYEFPASLILF